MKLLLIHTGNLGDLISASPVIYQLLSKYPILSVFIRKAFRGIFSGNPPAMGTINEITEAQSIQKIHYDWVIDLDASSTSRKLLRSLKYNQAWGLYANWLKKLKHSRLYNKQFPKHQYGHIVRDYDPVYHALGGQGRPVPRLPTQTNSALVQELAALKTNRRGLIGLHVHASNSIRSLPLDIVIPLMQALHQHGFALALIASAENDSQTLLNALDFNVFFRPFNIADLKTVLQNLDYFIACDSGPLHLAAALGCKGTGIYGPSLAEHYASGSPDISSIEKTFDCRPCNQDKPCPYERRCLNSIEAEEVLARVEKVL